jgi:hypothetical protein
MVDGHPDAENGRSSNPSQDTLPAHSGSPEGLPRSAATGSRAELSSRELYVFVGRASEISRLGLRAWARAPGVSVLVAAGSRAAGVALRLQVEQQQALDVRIGPRVGEKRLDLFRWSSMACSARHGGHAGARCRGSSAGG